MRKKILFSIVLSFTSLFGHAQEVGQIREVKMILSDIPFSGDAIQPNFINSDTSEIVSFNDMTWLDKHVSLFDFFHEYRDSCRENTIHFTITMIYLPKAVYNHVRYEGYIPTGDTANTWVLTSILKETRKSESVEIDYSKILKGKYILEGANYAGYNFIDAKTMSWTNELFPMDPDIMHLVWLDKNTFVGTYKRLNDNCPPGQTVNRVISFDGNKLELLEINTGWEDHDEQILVFYKEQ